MTPNQRATIETVARQAGISEAERRAWVAGAKWGLAQRNAPEPQKPLPVAALIGGTEWKAPTSINAPASTMRGAEEVRAEIERLWQSLLDKDDHNSPADYPDMAMLTFDEFSGYINHTLRWALNEQEAGR
jgi:hypothetical protein